MVTMVFAKDQLGRNMQNLSEQRDPKIGQIYFCQITVKEIYVISNHDKKKNE